jgi:hypothetical protein
MPDVSKEEIGRRMFQLHKDKNVEQVILKVRDTIGADWKSFTQEEVRLFERLLGMGWTHMEKAKWEKIPFATMTKEDVKRILAIARCIDIEKASQQMVVEKVEKALLKVG